MPLTAACWLGLLALQRGSQLGFCCGESVYWSPQRLVEQDAGMGSLVLVRNANGNEGPDALHMRIRPNVLGQRVPETGPERPTTHQTNWSMMWLLLGLFVPGQL